MKDHEINQAIAESVGFTSIRMSALWEFTDPPEDHQVLCGLNKDGKSRAIANYCNDLNAIQEAEKTIFGSSNAWEDFTINLICVLKASSMVELDVMVCLLQATARQRAEAYLRTIGKWRGE